MLPNLRPRRALLVTALSLALLSLAPPAAQAGPCLPLLAGGGPLCDEPANHAPDAPAAPRGPSQVRAGESAIFCSSARDADGDAVSIEFYWGDGRSDRRGPAPSGQEICAAHAWSAPGTYCVSARAYDREDASARSPCVAVSVKAQNRAPVIVSGPDGPSEVRVGSSAQYCAVAQDPDGDQIQYVFSFGEGDRHYGGFQPSGSRGCQQNIWEAPGNYDVCVEAYDIHGARASLGVCRVVRVV